MSITLNSNMYYAGLTNLALFIKMYSLESVSRSDELINSFMTETLSYGDTKIFRTLPLPEVGDYSKTSSLLSDHTASITIDNVDVNVVEDSIKIDKFKVIPSTYSREVLDMAVTSADGANTFISHVLHNMEAAKVDYLYDEIINKLFTNTYNKTETIHVFDTSDATSVVELDTMEKLNQKYITLGLQKVLDDLQVFSTKYNKYGLKQAVTLDDLRFVVCQPYKNEGVVNLMAELLRSNLISEDFPKPDSITIPELKIPENNETVVGFLMHKKYIQLFYNMVFMGNFFDPSTLRVNNFLHFWYGLGQVDQLPAVKVVIAKDKSITPPTPTPEPGEGGEGGKG